MHEVVLYLTHDIGTGVRLDIKNDGKVSLGSKLHAEKTIMHLSSFLEITEPKNKNGHLEYATLYITPGL